MGEYSYFGPNLAPNHDPDSWNYPYDHYRGFITGSVEGGSYSQREPRPHPQSGPARFYPPPTRRALVCASTTIHLARCRSKFPPPAPPLVPTRIVVYTAPAHLTDLRRMAGNTFLYPPQTATRCTENNATFVDDETCGTMGTANLFQADQTTEYCNQKEGGRISGPDSKNWNGTYPTITTLIGTQAVLYQVWRVSGGLGLGLAPIP